MNNKIRVTAMSYSTVCMLILAINTLHCSVGQNENVTRLYLEKALFALESGLQFFDREHATVNMDAIFGTRLVEGQLNVLLQRIRSKPQSWNIDNFTIDRIADAANLAKEASDKALPYIIKNSPKDYHGFENALQSGFWSINYKSRNFPKDVTIWPLRGEAYPISRSDYCIAWALGKTPETTEQCIIPRQCWELMRTPGFSGYALSHQIFYTVIALMNGCGNAFETTRLLYGDPPLDYLQTHFCANMLNEARSIASNGYQPRRQDLFAENAALCGLLGFREFFNYEWLDRLISWQDPFYGCFKELDSPPTRPTQTGSNTSTRKRKKRSEKQMIDGCLSHKTTVSISALSQYVRYLVEELAAGNIKSTIAK